VSFQICQLRPKISPAQYAVSNVILASQPELELGHFFPFFAVVFVVFGPTHFQFRTKK
jgi:hypothetical protein